jgi:hypothetical protein
MKQTVRIGFAAVCLILGSSLIGQAADYEDEPVMSEGSGSTVTTYRMSQTVNLSGLSGLLRTNSATVMKTGHFVAGASGTFENSNMPSFKRYTVRGSLTLGVAPHLEVGVVYPFERLGGIVTARDLEASVKWNFLEQIGDNFPALAVIGTFIAPTGTDIDRSGSSPTGNEVATVDKYGFKFLGVASTDVDMRPEDDYIFGLYAQMGIYFRDLGEPQEEKHGLWGLGGVFPIGPVELILEGDGTIDNGGAAKENIARFTSALRYVVSRVSLTLGYEHTLKQKIGFSDSDGAVAAVSLIF